MFRERNVDNCAYWLSKSSSVEVVCDATTLCQSSRNSPSRVLSVVSGNMNEHVVLRRSNFGNAWHPVQIATLLSQSLSTITMSDLTASAIIAVLSREDLIGRHVKTIPNTRTA